MKVINLNYHSNLTDDRIRTDLTSMQPGLKNELK